MSDVTKAIAEHEAIARRRYKLADAAEVSSRRQAISLLEGHKEMLANLDVTGQLPAASMKNLIAELVSRRWISLDEGAQYE